MKRRLSVLPLSLSVLLGLCASANCAWVFTLVNDDQKITIDKKSSVVVENYLYQNGKEESEPYAKFVDLDSAIKSANAMVSSNSSIKVHSYVKAGASVIVKNKTISLKSGVSLYMPYDGKVCFTDDSDTYKEYISSANPDSNSGNVAKYRKSLIQLENSSLSIENGAELYIGGELGTRGVARYYSELLLDAQSHIECSGKIYAYGYIKEQNAINSNQAGNESKIRNECDPERYIWFRSGSYLLTALSIDDTSSGGTLKTLVDNNICPFNVFDFRNIQTFAKFSHGSVMDAKARIVVGTGNLAQYISTNVSIINTSGNNGLFLSSSRTSSQSLVSSFALSNDDDYLSLEYCPLKPGYTSKDSSPTKAVISENVDLGSLTINASAAKIDTANYFLPISYKIHCYVADKSRFNVKNKIKFLPGSKMTIEKGGVVDNQSSMIFLKSGQLANADGGIASTFNGKPTASFVVNGSFKMEKNSKIGGEISTESLTGNAKLDFSNVSSQSDFTVSSPEGTNSYEVKVTSNGLFKTEEGTSEMAQFVVGSTISSASDESAWTGDYISTRTLEISLDTSEGFEYNVANYQVYIADDENGTNQSELTSGSSEGSASFELIKGKYVKIVVSRAKSASFESPSLTYSSDSYYKVTDDMNLILKPNEGVVINLHTQNTSGAGTVKYSITESGTNYSVTTPSNDVVVLIKGSSFKFKVENKGVGTTSFDKAYIAKGKGGGFNADYTKDQYVSAYGLTDVQEIGDSYTGTADAEYTIFSTRSSSCLLPSALVLMADGTYKAAGEIKTGDRVVSFNHETGNLEENIVIGNDHSGKPEGLYDVTRLEFDNGKSADFIDEHGYFDATLNRYVYLHPEDAVEFIGHEFVFVDGNRAITKSKLCRVNVEKTFTKICSPATANHLNIVADGMLSIAGGLNGLFNIFEYDSETMRFNQDRMAEDIAEYGLLTYEDFKGFFPRKIYELLPCKYLGVSIGKGLMTWDVFRGYVEKWKGQLLENL